MSLYGIDFPVANEATIAPGSSPSQPSGHVHRFRIEAVCDAHIRWAREPGAPRRLLGQCVQCGARRDYPVDLEFGSRLEVMQVEQARPGPALDNARFAPPAEPEPDA